MTRNPETSQGKPASGRGARRRRHGLAASHPPSPGTAPGTLLADPTAPAPTLRLLGYGPEQLEESDGPLDAIPEARRRNPVLWVDVAGLGDAETIRRLGALFGLHELALEDVLNVGQRPKVETYDDHLFLVTRVTLPGDRLDSEQIALFVGDGWVLTFQERPGDCFEPVRERLRRTRGRIRTAGADYLAYALLDAVVDRYAPLLVSLGDRLDDMEEGLLGGEAGDDAVAALHGVRHDLLVLRRIVGPTRDNLASLLSEELPLVTDDTRVYLRDCHDHAIRLADGIESLREHASGLVQLHAAMAARQLNDITRVLTMIATLFIPLGFLAGLYGMNFNTDRSPFNMPELNWAYGYPFALVLMGGVAAVQLLVFRHKGWLGRKRPGR